MLSSLVKRQIQLLQVKKEAGIASKKDLEKLEKLLKKTNNRKSLGIK